MKKRKSPAASSADEALARSKGFATTAPAGYSLQLVLPGPRIHLQMVHPGVAPELSFLPVEVALLVGEYDGRLPSYAPISPDPEALPFESRSSRFEGFVRPVLGDRDLLLYNVPADPPIYFGATCLNGPPELASGGNRLPAGVAAIAGWLAGPGATPESAGLQSPWKPRPRPWTGYHGGVPLSLFMAPVNNCWHLPREGPAGCCSSRGGALWTTHPFPVGEQHTLSIGRALPNQPGLPLPCAAQVFLGATPALAHLSANNGRGDLARGRCSTRTTVRTKEYSYRENRTCEHDEGHLRAGHGPSCCSPARGRRAVNVLFVMTPDAEEGVAGDAPLAWAPDRYRALQEDVARVTFGPGAVCEGRVTASILLDLGKYSANARAPLNTHGGISAIRLVVIQGRFLAAASARAQ